MSKRYQVILDLGTVSYRFHHEPEWELIEDLIENAETAAKIRSDLERGNQAAWFCAKVSAEIGDFVASEYLGCCSYESFEKFKESEEYKSMCAAAFKQLEDSIIASGGKLLE